MAEASRGRVTITLGGTRQVVKVGAAVSDESLPGPGNKRSVRDRIGRSQLDGSLSFPSQVSNNKRQRGESYSTSLSMSTVEDVHIGKNDLRFKIMEKTVSRRAWNDGEQKAMDLREKLSRTVQRPSPSYGPHQSRQLIPQRKDSEIMERFPPARSAEDLPVVNSSRSSYSAWTLDHLRSRTSQRILCGSRGLSPPRNVGELSQAPVKRTYDDFGTPSYVIKDVSVAPRSVSSSMSFLTSSTLPSTSSNPTAPLPAWRPSSRILQKSSYTGGEQQTVEGLLNSLGLEKYAVIFKAEEVDMAALKQMGESDLKELGIPMGPRKKILLAASTQSKRPS